MISAHDGGELSVTPVLVEDAGHFRHMAIASAALAAGDLAETAKRAYHYNYRHARIRVCDEKAIKQALDDVRRALEMVEQIGWREPRKRSSTP